MILQPSLVGAQAKPEPLERRFRGSNGFTRINRACRQVDLWRSARIRVLKNTLASDWAALVGEFREHSGLRLPAHVEAAWLLPEGEFRYYRADVTSVRLEIL